MFSCKENYKMPDEVESIEVNVSVERFDQKFKNLDNKNLQQLKSEYEYLFPKKFTDEFWLKKSKDTLQLQLVEEVDKVFPGNNSLETALVSFYKYLKYYYPQIEVPSIVTLISEVDYKNSIILRKNILLIGLDNYLGKNHFFYQDIDQYIRENFEPDQILPDIAEAYAKKIVARTKHRDFVSQMVLYGKRIYLMKKLLPQTSLEEIFGYTKRDLTWISQNESFVWRYFIDKNLLFSTDKKLLTRFIYPAPFSKFYLEIDQQTPGKVGQYIGYEIVLSYMENNDVSLQQLMEIDEKQIFNDSKYKPKK